jgi:hypothetical protein
MIQNAECAGLRLPPGPADLPSRVPAELVSTEESIVADWFKDTTVHAAGIQKTSFGKSLSRI